MIVSKAATKEYRIHYDVVFGKRRPRAEQVVKPQELRPEAAKREEDRRPAAEDRQ